ncbi:MAG: TIGR00269 family protein, partial [Candidatus Hadarchaeales archaeon]
DRHLIRSVEHRFRRAVSEHGLIKRGERIAVAVSGGKDSISLLHMLAEREDSWRFQLAALTVDEGIEGYRERCIEVVRENVRELGVEWKLLSFRERFGRPLDEILKISEEKGLRLGPCTYCGVLRRSLLNQGAKELGADKLATAHNLDDEVQAIFLDYIRGDLSRLCRLGFRYESREGFVPRIKPLREIPEKEMAVYAMVRDFQFHLGNCPHRRGIHQEVEEFLNSLESKHPNSKLMILRFFDQIKPKLSELLPTNFTLSRCRCCGEPAAGELCKACELLQELGINPRASP